MCRMGPDTSTPTAVGPPVPAPRGAMTPGAATERRWTPSWPIDLGTTLEVLQHGRYDPTLRLVGREVWRTTRTPDGPATVRYARSGADVLATAWGPGAGHELDALPDVLGAGDDPAGFAAGAHPVMAAAHERFGLGWRVLRTTRVLEALVPAVLEQRVTGLEASRAWAGLVRGFGEPAPGPAFADRPMLVAPDGAGWARIPSWAWHRAGVDPGRARTIITLARRAEALESLPARTPEEAGLAMRSLPGIGVWTAAEVAVRALGDADAVSFGDFHLARTIVHFLTGRTDGTDEQLAELLTPWAGQRARAVRLLRLNGGQTLPRHAPRATITDHRVR